MVQQEDRFLPETEIRDDNVLRADYEKLRVAYELQRDIRLELNIDHKSSLLTSVTSHSCAKSLSLESSGFNHAGILAALGIKDFSSIRIDELPILLRRANRSTSLDVLIRFSLEPHPMTPFVKDLRTLSRLW